MFSSAGFWILLAFIAVTALVILWQTIHLNKTESWPLIEATIQSVSRVVVKAGRSSYPLDVGDFSYNISEEYYSGRLTISSSHSTGDSAPRVLINQKIQVHYDPQKPESFAVPQQEVENFVLGPYNAPYASDEDPIDLNIDKI